MVPFAVTAALAADSGRVASAGCLLLLPALSSVPGHARIQEARCLAEGNVAAAARLLIDFDLGDDDGNIFL
jgi:hypothetical protein